IGGDERDVGAQPAAQGLDRRGLAPQMFRQLGELLHFTPVDRLEQGLSGREMAIERADADPGLARHGFEAGLRTSGAERFLGGGEETLAVAQRIGARPSRRFCRLLSRVTRHFLPAALKTEGASVYSLPIASWGSAGGRARCDDSTDRS